MSDLFQHNYFEIHSHHVFQQSILFFLLTIIPLCKYHSVFGCSPVDHLDCFQFLALTSKMAVNIYV